MSTSAPSSTTIIKYEGAEFAFTVNGDGEPLARDVDVARWLGFERERKIRELIERHRPSLGEVSPYRGAKPSSPSGGRPGSGSLLTEAQALYLAAKSETPNAVQVLKTMIAVYVLARRGSDPLQALRNEVAELRGMLMAAPKRLPKRRPRVPSTVKGKWTLTTLGEVAEAWYRANGFDRALPMAQMGLPLGFLSKYQGVYVETASAGWVAFQRCTRCGRGQPYELVPFTWAQDFGDQIITMVRSGTGYCLEQTLTAAPQVPNASMTCDDMDEVASVLRGWLW